MSLQIEKGRNKPQNFESILKLKKHYTPIHVDEKREKIISDKKREGTGLGQEFISGIREKLGKK